MSFISIKFLLFFAVLLLLIAIVKKENIRQLILLIFSYVFYALSDYRFLILLVFVSGFTWIMGKSIGTRRDSNDQIGARRFLVAGLFTNVLILVVFKYYGFFVKGFAGALNMNISTAKLLVPIGISFYILQAISYLCDIYFMKIRAEDNPVKVLLFVGFFPQVVSGPIMKAHDFMPMLKSEHRITKDNISQGMQRFVVGMFKKAVVADRLGACVDSVYSAVSSYSGLSVALAVASYSLQIYFDFSGYSDMAIGIAKVLGYELTENFNLPYLATNPSDFWKRWHISLSSFLKEYVYIPLGGSRNGKLRTYINLFLTMLVSGLWHGISMAYIVWGLMHALLSTIHKIFLDTASNKKADSILTKLISVIAMFVIVSILWIPFRTDDLKLSADILIRIFTGAAGITYVYDFTLLFSVLLIVVQVIAVCRNSGNSIFKPLDLSLLRNKIIFLIFALFTISMTYVGNTAFIYSKF